MGQDINSVVQLLDAIESAMAKLDIEQKKLQLQELDSQIAEPDFWNDNRKAQDTSQKRAKLNNLIEPWQILQTEVKELQELSDLDDASLKGDIDKQLAQKIDSYQKLAFQLKFSGKYDSFDAILSLQSGAGGTDAQDWAQMLERMYLRWAEQSAMKAELIDESSGEEAGIKSATLMISGTHVYGKLKGEHGVHRLVRLSPFNSGQTRETSFAMVEVVPQIDKPDELEIDEKDLKVDTYRASGHGGQSVNTTDSAVRITHLPSGLTVSIQNEKSQIQNRETAMKVLKSKLVQLQAEQHKEKLSELKGPNQEAAWGNQIRSYVLHPYTMVKDSRSKYETNDVKAVLDGQLDELIEAYLSL